jgi:hypothetical protein
MFTIETITIPEAATRARTKGPFAATLAQLEVGQSFFAPDRKAKGTYAALSPSKNGGKKFRAVPWTETIDGVEQAGVRVVRKA